ncbi:MAG: histidine phosphatase family protein [Anaerolineae bacterium]
MTDVYLFRHAHVDYTPPAAITAHNPLTPLGHQMAARLAERCDALELQCLFASTLTRAQQTADAITARFPDLPRIDMPEFAETNYGDLDQYPDELPDEDMNLWEYEHLVFATARTFERVVIGWNKVCQVIDMQGLKRVGIVSHGNALSTLIHHFIGAESIAVTGHWFIFDWASTSCLRFEGDRRWVRWVNESNYVKDLY